MFKQQEKSHFNLCSFFFQQKVFVIWFRWDQLGISSCPQQEEFFFYNKKIFLTAKNDRFTYVGIFRIDLGLFGVFLQFFSSPTKVPKFFDLRILDVLFYFNL
jgi:hypothetical protein